MFKNISLSLADITGREYINGIIDGACFFGTLTRDEAEALAYEKVDFYPVEAQLRNSELLLYDLLLIIYYKYISQWYENKCLVLIYSGE